MSVEALSGSMIKVTLPEGKTVDDMLGTLQESELLSSVEPDYHYYAMDELEVGAASGLDDDLSVSGADSSAGSFNTFVSPNDPDLSAQWGFGSANVLRAWDYVASNRFSATSVPVIAVIDQGFDAFHPDLKNMVVGTYNAVTGSTDVSGAVSHGTHVAGIVGAQSNNGIGVSGTVNNHCRLLLIKVADSDGRIVESYLENAFTYLERMRASGVNVRVANMSLGGFSTNPIAQTGSRLYSAIASAADKKIVTVAAAGNRDGHTTWPLYVTPGDFDNVVSVINLQENGGSSDGVTRFTPRSGESNYNVVGQTAKNISAPGTSILSTISENGEESYGRKSGTSMASPMVAGVVGLMLTVNPDLKSDEVRTLLYSTARDLKAGEFSAGWDRFSGYGEIDALAAAKASKTNPVIHGDEQAFVGTATSFSITQGGAIKGGYIWTSSNPSIATVTSAGTLVGKKPGTVIVRAMGPGGPLQKVVKVFGISGSTAAKSGQTVKYSISPNALGSWRWRLSSSTYASINASTGKMTVKQASKARKVTVTVIATAAAGKGLSKGGTLQQKVTLTITEKITKKSVYKLVNKKTGVRYYTTKVAKRNKMRKAGWKYEGVAWSAVSKSSIPVYQLYHKKSHAYYYTRSKSQYKKLKKSGYRGDGIVWYSSDKKTKKIYCASKKMKQGYVYNYTKSKSAHNKLLKSGWKHKGVAFWGY